MGRAGTTSEGFVLALNVLRRLLPKGLSWWAPPCGTWVYMSRGSTGRSKSDPLGFTSVECVAAQNRLVKRVVLLLRFVVCMGLFWILEQPTSSILQDHPTFQRNAKRLGKKQAFLWMRCFGAATPKGTQLWGNAPWLKKTQRKLRKSELLGDET